MKIIQQQLQVCQPPFLLSCFHVVSCGSNTFTSQQSEINLIVGHSCTVLHECDERLLASKPILANGIRKDPISPYDDLLS